MRFGFLVLICYFSENPRWYYPIEKSKVRVPYGLGFLFDCIPKDLMAFRYGAAKKFKHRASCRHGASRRLGIQRHDGARLDEHYLDQTAVVADGQRTMLVRLQLREVESQHPRRTGQDKRSGCSVRNLRRRGLFRVGDDNRRKAASSVGDERPIRQDQRKW